MSSLSFNQTKNIPLPLDVAENQAATYFDVVSASASDQVRNRLGISKDLFATNLRHEREAKYKELTGRSLADDIDQEAGTQNSLKFLAGSYKADAYENPDFNAAVNRKILSLRTEDPKKYADLLTNEELEQKQRDQGKEASVKAQRAEAGANHEKFFSAFGYGPSPANLGALAGSMGGDLVDPANIVSMGISPVRGMKVMGKILLEAGSNMAAEASRQGDIEKWQKEIGNEYGWTDKAQNVFIAGAFSTAMAGAKELAPALKSAAGRFEIIKGKLKEAGAPPSVVAVAEKVGREAHAMEANPLKDNPDLDTGGHVKSLQEVETALKEGRPIKTENLGVTEADMHAVDTTIKPEHGEIAAHRLSELEEMRTPKEIDPVKVENQRRLDELMGDTPKPTAERLPNPREDYHPDVFPKTDMAEHEVRTVLEASESRAKQEFAPDNVKSQELDLDTYLNDPTAENITVEVDGKKTTAAEFKNNIKKQKNWLEAIRVCGITGRQA